VVMCLAPLGVAGAIAPKVARAAKTAAGGNVLPSQHHNQVRRRRVAGANAARVATTVDILAEAIPMAVAGAVATGPMAAQPQW